MGGLPAHAGQARRVGSGPPPRAGEEGPQPGCRGGCGAEPGSEAPPAAPGGRANLQAVAAALGASLPSAKARAEWAEAARVGAILGRAPRSNASLLSAWRAWHAFATKVLAGHGSCMPPSVDALVSWSALFKSHRTYSNYVSKLRTACELLRVPTESTHHPSVKGAAKAIQKREPPPRVRKALGQKLVGKLTELALLEGDRRSCALYLLSYSFLLRVQSEAMPMLMGAPELAGRELEPGRHSRLCCAGDRLELVLARRKNRPHGSRLVRHCSCPAASRVCPVHRLRSWFEDIRPGPLFAGVSAQWALAELRRRLGLLGVADPAQYTLHSLRRGKAQDLLRAGGRLVDILRAGEWTSAAFAEYLDLEELDGAAELEAHLAESGSDLDVN